MIHIDAEARELTGDDRYMEASPGSGEYRPVHPSYTGYAYGDHDKLCPSKVGYR